MTVAELIDKLREMPGDAPVLLHGHGSLANEYLVDVEMVRVVMVDTSEAPEIPYAVRPGAALLAVGIK